MGLTIEAEITPGMSTKEVTQLATVVEEVGFDRLGISDVALYPDSFQIQTLCALATKRIRIGSLVTNPYTRHPAVLAGAVATLQDVSEGRAFLGLGVGAGLEPLGVGQAKPVSALRESVHIIRKLLAGDTVTYQGRIFDVTRAKLTLVPAQPIPILIGTRSPQTMKLAGEVADIAVVGARYLSAQMAQTYCSWIAEGAGRVGRTLQDIEVAPRITLCVSRNGELARQSVKLYAAYYLVLLKPKDVPIEAARLARIEEAVQRVTDWYFSPHLHYPTELDALITDDIVNWFAVAGTPQECVHKIQRIVDLGFTSVSMNLAAVRRGSMYEGLRETITSFGEVVPQIKCL
jgi:5,10-methylenetetrahydromethanopterin reductase